MGTHVSPEEKAAQKQDVSRPGSHTLASTKLRENVNELIEWRQKLIIYFASKRPLILRSSHPAPFCSRGYEIDDLK